jgi:small-conductance mechanosensitive channel
MIMLDLAFLHGQTASLVPTIIPLVILLAIAFLIYKLITAALRKTVMKRARTKKQKSNALMFLGVWRYTFTLIVVAAFIVFLVGGDLTGLGIWAGLMSAALGWALQRPITGLAGWVMVVIKKPFQIGDRVLIGTVKGDVTDINITHTHLREVGGTIASEEVSGRIVLIPNSKLFEQDIINYTLTDDYILDEVSVAITYESNLDKAIAISKEAVKKVTKSFVQESPKKPFIRTFFAPSAVDVKARYYVRPNDRIKVSSDLTQEIFRGISKVKDVEIAYPHTEVVLRKKQYKR